MNHSDISRHSGPSARGDLLTELAGLQKLQKVNSITLWSDWSQFISEAEHATLRISQQIAQIKGLHDGCSVSRLTCLSYISTPSSQQSRVAGSSQWMSCTQRTGCCWETPSLRLQGRQRHCWTVRQHSIRLYFVLKIQLDINHGDLVQTTEDLW